MIPYAVLRDPNVSHAAMVVYGRLKLYAGTKGEAYPKQETLAKEVRLSDRQLKRVLVELRDTGWISWERTRNGCVYTMNPDKTYMSHLEGAEIGRTCPIRHDKNVLSGEPLYRKEKKFEKMYPLTPKGEGNVFPDTDPEDPPFAGPLDPQPALFNGNNHVSKNGTNHGAKLEEVIQQTAERIHQRHPNNHSRRDCTAALVPEKLKAILKHLHIEPAEQQSYLERIDHNHEAWCASEKWQKQDGQYVDGLKKWLRPSNEYYLVEPSAPKPRVQSAGTVYREYDPPKASNE
jgi:hypothetical protein